MDEQLQPAPESWHKRALSQGVVPTQRGFSCFLAQRGALRHRKAAEVAAGATERDRMRWRRLRQLSALRDKVGACRVAKGNRACDWCALPAPATPSGSRSQRVASSAGKLAAFSPIQRARVWRAVDASTPRMLDAGMWIRIASGHIALTSVATWPLRPFLQMFSLRNVEQLQGSFSRCGLANDQPGRASSDFDLRIEGAMSQLCLANTAKVYNGAIRGTWSRQFHGRVTAATHAAQVPDRFGKATIAKLWYTQNDTLQDRPWCMLRGQTADAPAAESCQVVNGLYLTIQWRMLPAAYTYFSGLHGAGVNDSGYIKLPASIVRRSRRASLLQDRRWWQAHHRTETAYSGRSTMGLVLAVVTGRLTCPSRYAAASAGVSSGLKALTQCTSISSTASDFQRWVVTFAPHRLSASVVIHTMALVVWRPFSNSF